MKSDWRELRLGDVCPKIGSGATPRGGGRSYVPVGVTLIRSQNVHNAKFVPAGLVRITDAAAQKLEGVTVRPQDVLINITGESVARACIAPANVVPARVNQHVAILRPDPAVLLPKFLLYWLISSRVQGYLRQLAGAGATRRALTKVMLEELKLLVPGIEDQQRVVSILGTLDDKVESNRRLATLFEEAAAAVFQARFVSFFGVEGFEESQIGPIPRGWQVLRLSDAVDVNPRVPLRKGTVTPYIEMAAVGQWAVRPTDIGERPYSGGSRFEPDDTLMARITGCIEHGKGAFVDFLSEPGSGSTEFIVLRAKHPLTPEAVFLLSRDDRVRSHAIANMTGSSGRQRVPTTAFDDLKIAVPPDLESWQDEGEFLRAAFAQSRALWRESRTLTEIRNALLPKLISGQIQPSETVDSDELIDVAVEVAT